MAMNCKNGFHSDMPDTDPASPVDINGWRSCTRCGMTTFLDSLGRIWKLVHRFSDRKVYCGSK